MGLSSLTVDWIIVVRFMQMTIHASLSTDLSGGLRFCLILLP